MTNSGFAALRVGTGYDAHRFTDGRPLVLGGVRIAHSRGLLGHSDADALAHAVMDALLGAACMRDIGALFPDSGKAFEGISSMKLLVQVGQKLRGSGFEIINIDATIVAQEPRLSPHIDEMRANMANSLYIDVNQVNVKATTEEGMGFTGAREGIAAQAVCLIAAASIE